MANFLEGINVSGEYISTIEDKSFTILRCQYRDTPDFNGQGTTERKLILKVRISNGQELDYYPNKTSQKVLAHLFGFDMDGWIGKKATWGIIENMVLGDKKKILFVILPDKKK